MKTDMLRWKFVSTHENKKLFYSKYPVFESNFQKKIKKSEPALTMYRFNPSRDWFEGKIQIRFMIK